MGGARMVGLGVAILWGVGCAGRDRVSLDPLVSRIHFTGTAGALTDRSDANLRQTMSHPSPRYAPWPVRKRVPLDGDRLEPDRLRVLTYLAHRGFFDADLDWVIEERRPATDRRSARVTLRGEVTLGPAYEVTDVVITGLAALPRPLRGRLRRGVPSAGSPFTLAQHDLNRGTLLRTLQERGHPEPEVEGQVEVRTEDRTVTLRYAVDPGPSATLGDIVVDGRTDVPRAAVDRRLRLRPGDRYDVSALEKARGRLYGMDVFSLVSVAPRATDDPTRVDVAVHVEERPPRGIALRGGIEIQSGRQEALGGLDLSHLNAFGRLWRAELSAEAGVAVLGSGLGQLTSLSDVRTGPVADVGLDLGVPNLPRSNWDTFVQLGYEHALTEAFRTNRPSVGLSVRHQPTRTVTWSGGYRFDFVQYVDLQVDPDELEAFGAAPDLVDGRYRNAELRTQLVWDTRDDPLAPTRGHVVDVLGELAGSWLGGQYNYGGGQVDLRGYRGLGRRAARLRRTLGIPRNALVFAGRLGGGVLAPYGPEARSTVPVAERLYLGGTGSVRGWTFQHLGPYVCEAEENACQSEVGVAVPEGVDTVPLGGRIAAWGSAEVRQTFGQVRVVAFTDAGMVWATPAEVRALRPQVSVGLGGRYLTPVGPVRLDVAVRTGNPEIFSHEPRFWLHLGLGEAF